MFETENQNDSLSVLLADDHRMVVEIFALFLSGSSGMKVDIADDLDGALEKINEHGAYDVVLLDLNMPGMNGVAGLRRVTRQNAEKPVGIITSNPTSRMVDELLAAGASGIVLKTTPLRSLANAIRFMAGGDCYLPIELMRSQQEAQRASQQNELSDRELEVLEHIAAGLPNKIIASEMQLSEPTVKMHVVSIYRKLGATNRTKAALIARDLGLV
jgi:DNA-binding NarL/FixJ family response regulator